MENNDHNNIESIQKSSLPSLALNVNKAGMDGLDTERINEIIQKASEGSQYFQHKQKCQARIDARILVLKKTLAELTKEQIEKATLKANRLAQELEFSRKLDRVIVHVDMDMFYAAVEMRDDPLLRDKPMAVGSTSMLSTSNYIARKFGVRAAMPGFIAIKLCPDLVIVRPNFEKYKKVSAEVQEIFAVYDRKFCPMSLDEAYLDITDYIEGQNNKQSENDDSFTAEEIVSEMRKKIFEKTHLTASAGIASNARLAKICSDINKPNGQFYVPPDREEILKFIRTLPIRKISGIGNVMEQQLHAFDVHTCNDLWEKRGLLSLVFSETSFGFFLEVALGIGSSEISPAIESDRKSMSTETTFSGTSDIKKLNRILEKLCHELADDMEDKNMMGKVFTLKMKTVSFQIQTRTQTLFDPTRDACQMIKLSQQLLKAEIETDKSASKNLSFRLLGVRMSSLVDNVCAGTAKQVTLADIFNKMKNMPLNKPKGSATESNDTHCVKHSSDILILNSESDIDQLKSAEAVCADSKMYCCPVCMVLVGTNSLEEFNIHIDSCLESVNIKNKDTSLSSSHNGPSNSKDFSVCDQYKTEFTCPVCVNQSFTSCDEVNAHLDICLNKSVIRKMLHDGISAKRSFMDNKTSKKRKVSNTLEKYLLQLD